MSRRILAIDIRSTSIAAVLISTGLKNNSVQDCLFVPLSQDPDASGNDALANAIETVLHHFDADGAILVIAIPSDQVFYRSLVVPFKDETKIRQILPFELESHLPVNPDELAYDFLKSTENDQTTLLVTAMEKSRLNDYLETFNSKGKPPQLVVPGSLPILVNLLLAYNGLPDSDQAIMLDIDVTNATLYVIDHGDILLSRSFSLSESTKDAGIELLVQKIRQTLSAYADTRGIEFTPQTVYLSGPAMRDEKKRQTLGATLPWPVELTDMRNLAPKLEIDETVEAYNHWLSDNALALAMVEGEGRNCPGFHRSNSPLRNLWSNYRTYIIEPAILLALVLFLALGGILLENHALQKRVNTLDAQIAAVFKSAFPDTDPMSDAVSHMKSKIKEVQANAPAPIREGAQRRSVDILNEISRLIPKETEVHFTRMVIGSDSVTIAGKTSAFNMVDNAKGRLEQSEMFKKVEIASANMDKSGTTVSFKFTINL
jgi:general secretion pathway protein L